MGHPAAPPAGVDVSPADGRWPIDAVFTWVDGSSPTWLDEFERWSRCTPDTAGPDGRHPARYREHGELRFALRSVWTFAPWIRRIYVVTAGDRPVWLGEHPRVEVVGHAAILAEGDRPTFNSHAIEARLHHLPELAEHFVYLNDDMFFGRPQRVERYVDRGGRIHVQLSDHPLPDITTSTGAMVDLAALNALELLRSERRHAVSPSDRRPGHGPMMNRRSHLCELERRFSSALATTAHSRFRADTDVALPTFLAPVDALSSGRADPADLVVGYVGLDDADLGQQLERFATAPGVDAFCLNDTERVPADAVALRRRIDEFLRRCFPTPAPWEIEPDTARRPNGRDPAADCRQPGSAR